MTKTLIEFQDHHQDFLVWTVDEAGIVIESWPYQTDVWGGLKIVNLASLKVGGVVEYLWEGRSGSVKYPVHAIQPLVPVEVLVRMNGDGYVTSTVHGKRVSCTHDYEYPVKRLAEKLFLGRHTDVERLPCTPVGRLHSKWRVAATAELRALLDAPEALIVPLTGPKEWLDSLKSAAQRQGDPVVRLEIGADRTAALSVTDAEWLRALKDSGVHQIVPLYAEAPASSSGEPVHQWSDDGGVSWCDGNESSLQSAREAGWKTRTLYVHQPVSVAVSGGDR